MVNRYDASGSIDGRFQPGLDERVLLNKLNITDPKEMNDVELLLLEQLTFALLDEVTQDQNLTVADICEWHRRWLGNVYDWAGQFRSVNLGKGGFHFAVAAQLPRLMVEFDQHILGRYTPCRAQDDEPLSKALAVVHIEFILLHPFREGNGRLSRLIATIMALQAGRPALDFSCLDNDKSNYFSAIQSGLDDSAPMQDLFRQVLRESEQNI